MHRGWQFEDGFLLGGFLGFMIGGSFVIFLVTVGLGIQ
jgi:hypothetical protein